MLKWGAIGIGVVALATSAYAQVDLGPVTGWGFFTQGQSTSSPERVKKLFSGSDLVYGLREDNSYFVYGSDQTGAAAFPLGGANAAQISVGNGFTVVLDNAGHAIAFGANGSGQATVPPSLPILKYVAAGDQAVLAVTSAGTVTGWGSTAYGILTPPAGLNHVVKVATGYFHGAALKSDGTVVAWGNDSFHQTEVPSGLTGVVDIVAGREHTVALKSDGTVVAWGDNSKGECTIPASSVPYVRISACQLNTGLLTLGGTAVGIGTYAEHLLPAAGHHFVDIGSTTLGLYGLLDDGQLAGGFRGFDSQVGGSPLEQMDAIQVFGDHVLHADGSVTVRGQVIATSVAAITKSNGMLFTNGHATDYNINLTGIKQVDFDTALRTDGTVVYTGGNPPSTFPTNIAQVCGAYASGFGASPSVGGGARSATGSVYIWGDNSYGQTTIPTSVANIIDLSYNYATVAAVSSGGVVTAWGRNDFHQATVPSGLANVIKVDAGQYSTVALRGDGSLVQWGAAPDATGVFSTVLAPIPARCFGGAQILATANQSVRTIGLYTNWDSFNNGMTTSFTGTVVLPKASTSATSVTLASSAAGVGVPPTVVVPAGQHSATFPITMAVTASGTYSVVASSAGFNATASFLVRVDDIDFTSVTPYTTTINSGDGVMVQVKFAHAALHPYPLHITTTGGLAALPTVDVPAGATSVVFPVASFPTSTNSTETITASGSLGRTISGQVNLRSIGVTSAEFPGPGHAGQLYSMQVNISRAAPATGLTVHYAPFSGPTSDSGTIFFPPGTITAAKLVKMDNSNVYPYAIVQTQVTFESTQNTAMGQVYPNEPRIFLYSSSVVGGHGTTLVLQLPTAAPAGGVKVNLTAEYDHTVGLTFGMPNQVTIPAGSTTANVPLTTTAVTANDHVTIFAFFPGGNEGETNLLVTAPRVTALSLSPSTLVGGGHSTGTVTISDPAPAGGLVVQLTVKDSNAVFLPSSTVTIAAGATTATFDVATTSVTSSQTARIGATVNGAGVQATLTVTP